MKKKILITGGAGFIGSHLCEKLVNSGQHVICLDNLITGNYKNISSLTNRINFEFINHDITEPFFRDDIKEIYNLACPASPIHYQINPIKTIKTCTLGVINMLGLAKKNKAKILQASTSEVYGDPLVHPQPENYFGNVNPTGIRSCYDEGKRCSEALFMDYHRTHKLDIKIVRIFNTYGPRMLANDGRVVSNFIIQALTNKDLTIFGDGSQSRSFQYIDDLVEGIFNFMQTGKDYLGPINLGNPHEISVKELAKKIILLTNSNSNLSYKELPADDPKKRRPDISKAKNIIDFKPKFDLEIGLTKTIKYFENFNK